jgi:hypothetical protein
MVFLEQEVKEFFDAGVYLDRSNPQADLMVDLLLGAQGWRRFAFLNINQFLEEHTEKAERVAATTNKNMIFPEERMVDFEAGAMVNQFRQFDPPRRRGPATGSAMPGVQAELRYKSVTASAPQQIVDLETNSSIFSK